MFNKAKKIFVSCLVLGSAFVVLPSTTIGATTSYTKETKTLYAVVDGVQTPIKVDYITNPNGGAVLTILHDEHDTYILTKTEGAYEYAFKDMDKDGALDVYEDWREPTAVRVADLAADLASTPQGIEMIAGLMLFSSHERDSATGLTNAQKDYLVNSHVRNITDAAGNDVKDSVGWTNAMQAFVEQSDFNVPVNFSSDPRSTAGSGDLYSTAETGMHISGWPSNLGMTATFDTNHMYNFAKATSAEYRSMGIITALGPQIDLSTDPRWLRVGGTFGEDTKLSTDMAQAYVDGSQSTYAADGTDLGWGSDSINAMIKHFPGDGPGEGGRESHMRAGKYAVYPGGNYAEHLIPFAEGGLKLKGLTGSAASIMTSYSIAINGDGSVLGGVGNRVGSAYSQFKMDILRDDLGFDGVVCTDWGVTSTPPTPGGSGFGMGWGTETLTSGERHFAILDAGTDMFGGNNVNGPIVEAYQMFVNRDGEAAAQARFAKSAERLLTLTMQAGMFENPYLDADASLAIAGSEDKMAAGYAAQLDSVVMLKNKDNTIKPVADTEKLPSEMTVYIPKTFTKAVPTAFGGNPEAWSDTMSVEAAKEIYGTVLTDSVDAEGNVTTPDLSNVDKVIIGMRSVDNGTQFTNSGIATREDGTTEYYHPLSLQYGPYVANGDNVRKTSIAGDILNDGSQENRSYFGEESVIYNAYDLTAFLNTVDAINATGKDIPVVVTIIASNPVIVSEFEEKADAIIVSFSVSDRAVFDIIEGKHEPKGLLPIAFPINMDAVEANHEDVAHDIEAYKDSQGNTYGFAYGLNWSGQILDDRVNAYDKDIVLTNTPSTSAALAPKAGDTTNVAYYTLFGMLAATTVLVVYKKRKSLMK